ncbi:hypothetical protein [Azotobacter chroococcum]|uniref:hypothetical protein n=1 Tax=Azotobacter chroococcum TaxID=353 RepID=UPI000585A46A|nr:hypothetical protein [Azotobacter chroococcum]
MWQLWGAGGVLLASLSVPGLLLQGQQIRGLKERLAEARASLERLRIRELELEQTCRELRSELRAERARTSGWKCS